MKRIALLLALLAAAGAADAAPPAKTEVPQLLVIGLDGVTWRIIDPLVTAGKLPHIAALAKAGTRATLESVEPMFSPRLWTTISTGVPAERHGVTSYIDFLPGSGRIAELELYGLPGGAGTLQLSVTSPEPQRLAVSLDGARLAERRLKEGWQDVDLAVPARSGARGNVLSLDHERRWLTGKKRPLIGGGQDEELARTAGYDRVVWQPGTPQEIVWDLGDYGKCGNLLKSGFDIERQAAPDGRDYLWAGRATTIPVSSAWRRVPALWNVLSGRGLRVGVIGHWATWPAERVNGFMVSDRVIYGNFNKERSALDGTVGETHPQDLVKELLKTLVHPDLLPETTLRKLSVDPAETGFRHEFEPKSKLRAALASTENYRTWAVKLLAREEPDFFFVYFDAPDVVSHVALGEAFRSGRLDTDSTVARTYELMDEAVGAILAVARPERRVLLVSDHGFEVTPAADLQKYQPELRATNNGRHQKDGILLVTGPGVAAGRTIPKASIYDVTPTILSLFDLPAAEDMPGQALDIWAVRRAAIPRIKSYGTMPTANGRPAHGSDEALKEHLRSLGYIR